MKTKSVANTIEDPTIRFSTVDINGEKYKMAFTFNAIARAEALTGLNLLEGFTASKKSALQFRALFFAALSIAHPTLTLEDVGNLMSSETLVPMATALEEAYLLSMPDKDEDDSKNVKAPVTAQTPSSNAAGATHE